MENDFNEIDIAFDLNLEEFGEIEIDLSFEFDSRIHKPPRVKELSSKNIKYKYAHDLANDVKIEKGCRYNVVVNGSFIFGDFIEALIVNNNYHVKKMTISTLSMSQNNVDSLANLINGNYLDELNLIVSDFFFSHERHGLIKYAYDILDIGNKFQLAVCRTHCKLCIIETHCGLKLVIHGSANLRSSDNIEQFAIEDSETFFDYQNEYQDRIIEKFQTINKTVRGKQLWQLITQEVASGSTIIEP